MKQRVAIILGLIFLALPCAELYQFFPRGRLYHFYPLSPLEDEYVRWYVKDLTLRLFLLSFTLYAWNNERKKPYGPLLFVLPLFFGMDIIAYLLSHSHAGVWYFIVYGPILIYAAYITYKRHIWQAAEWIYSKFNRNGSNRGTS